MEGLRWNIIAGLVAPIGNRIESSPDAVRARSSTSRQALEDASRNGVELGRAGVDALGRDDVGDKGQVQHGLGVTICHAIV